MQNYPASKMLTEYAENKSIIPETIFYSYISVTLFICIYTIKWLTHAAKSCKQSFYLCLTKINYVHVG